MNWLNRDLLLVPFPQEVKETGQDWALPRQVTVSLPERASERVRFATEWLADDLRRLAGADVVVGAEPCSAASGLSRADICLERADATGCAEGYTLSVRADGVTLIGDDDAGLAQGMQTLAQLVAFTKTKGSAPGMEIRDWPHYALRAVLLDIGRAPHPRPLIERVIRIMARLKLNLLHLHVHDDELNGVIYETLPLGRENPTALPISTYGEMIRCAERYGVQVMPELEAWGHVASLVHHYPHLYGYGGVNSQSFAIGEPTYELLEKMIAEWAPLLQGNPPRLHVGLDEADWALLKEIPPERQGDYSPVQHVRRLYEIVQRQGAKHGKRDRDAPVG